MSALQCSSYDLNQMWTSYYVCNNDPAFVNAVSIADNTIFINGCSLREFIAELARLTESKQIEWHEVTVDAAFYGNSMPKHVSLYYDGGGQIHHVFRQYYTGAMVRHISAYCADAKIAKDIHFLNGKALTIPTVRYKYGNEENFVMDDFQWFNEILCQTLFGCRTNEVTDILTGHMFW